MGRDSNAIIMNNELCLFPQRLRGKCDDRRCPPVTGGILEQLAQDEHRPLFIGIDGTIQFLRCHLNAALNQQRSMIFNRLGSNFSQIYLSKQAVLFRVLVHDNGIGIPAHELPRVFDRGFTGSNGRNRGGSTGMGLYLCKKLAGFLELGLEIASEEGKGTTVTLTFPAKENLTKL